MLTAADAVELFTLLRQAAVPFWVDGGWAVDALIGEQTRDHADLDLAVPCEHESRIRDLLAEQGFREVSAVSNNPVFADAQGRTLDLHFVDLSVVVDGPDGRAVHGGIAYDVGSFEGEGTIAGMAVPCVGLEFLVRYHTGYAFDGDDIHDVLALHRRFGIPLPEAYLPFASSAT